MQNKNIFTENDFDPNEAIANLLPAINGCGLPINFKLGESCGYLDVNCGKAALTNIGGAITANGERLNLSDFSLKSASGKTAEYVNEKYGLSWIWTVFARESDVLLMASLKNNSNVSITVKEWDLLSCDRRNGSRIFDSFSDKTTFLRYVAWDSGVWRLKDCTGNCCSNNIMHLFDPESNMTALVGFLTMTRMNVLHIASITETGGICNYCARLNFGEYELAPQQTFNSELCSISFHDDPYAALELWAEKVKSIYQPKFNLIPPVGLVPCWFPPRTAADAKPWEHIAIDNAKATRERLRGFDVGYFWISITNLLDYIPGNWLHENKKEFPGGLANFFKRLGELGFKGGLWVSPFWFFGEAENMLQEHAGHLLRDKEGEPMCWEQPWGSIKYDDDLPVYHMHKYNFDGSHPDTIEYVRKLFSYYREIGIRYYMLDFLGVVENSVLYDPSKTAYQAGYEILRTISETAGEDTHIQTAGASSPGFTGVINAARIGRDFGEGRPIDAFLSIFRNATHVLHDNNFANGKGFVQNIASTYFTHQNLYMNDYNLFTVDKPYPVEHARIVATAFGMGGGSPLMIGDNMDTIAEERLRYLKVCLPRTAHSAKPADLFERVEPHEYSRVQKLWIDAGWESYMVVGAYNFDDGPYGLTLDFGKLGLEPGEKYVVYDFWNEEYCGVFRGSYPCWLAPESCRLYRIAAERPHPWLLSTDMHIQQGCCEIVDVSWEPGAKRLRVSATRPAGERGNLFILMPRDYKLANYANEHLLKELLDFKVIMQVPVAFGSETMSFAFDFEEFDPSPLLSPGHAPYASKEEWLDYMKKNYHKQNTRVFE